MVFDHRDVDHLVGLRDRPENLPAPEHLAAADPDEVMAAWSGLGYYRRARAMLAAAEAEARLRGCLRARLSTFDFQARGFYEKQGYCVVGTLADYPPGSAMYWMRKDFSP